MDTPFQGAAWSVLHDHLPYYAGLLFSIPPVSFVLIKVALAARSASKHKATKQWYVTRDQDQELNPLSATPDARTRNSSDERLNRAVENILRSAEMSRAEDPTESLEHVAIQSESETTCESVATAELVAIEASVEAFETEALLEIVETEPSFEAIETDATVQEVETPAIPSIPARPCRQRHLSPQTSRSARRRRSHGDSRRLR